MLKATASVRSLNQRAEKRHRPQERVPVTVFILPDFRRYEASVKDLSVGGVGLYLCGSPPAPGARLLVRFPGPDSGTTHTALAEVVHSGRQENGYDLVGCKFLSRLVSGQLHESLRAGS
jgi:hypothetical protein